VPEGLDVRFVTPLAQGRARHRADAGNPDRRIQLDALEQKRDGR
jgi:hypothetical protein